MQSGRDKGEPGKRKLRAQLELPKQAVVRPKLLKPTSKLQFCRLLLLLHFQPATLLVEQPKFRCSVQPLCRSYCVAAMRLSRPAGIERLSGCCLPRPFSGPPPPPPSCLDTMAAFRFSSAASCLPFSACCFCAGGRPPARSFFPPLSREGEETKRRGEEWPARVQCDSIVQRSPKPSLVMHPAGMFQNGLRGLSHSSGFFWEDWHVVSFFFFSFFELFLFLIFFFSASARLLCGVPIQCPNKRREHSTKTITPTH